MVCGPVPKAALAVSVASISALSFFPDVLACSPVGPFAGSPVRPFTCCLLPAACCLCSPLARWPVGRLAVACRL